MKIRKLCATLLAITLVTLSTTVCVYADNSNEDDNNNSNAQPVTASESASESKAPEDSSEADLSSIVEDKDKDNDSNNATDSEIEKNLLEGNASLVKEQKIIHQSSEMQFIAVTTRNENVFYILIDYTTVDEQGNGSNTVYFLNNVRNTYGHYKLLE